jgi:phosphatidylserine/phosphatidylglycerophosphate/cardiolipin synthase-like enzyme
VRFKYYSYRWHYTYAEQMHHKYIVVDSEVVASGSYNLSDNAERNTMENMVLYHRSSFPALVDAFEANFEQIWETRRGDGQYDELMAEITSGSGEVPLVFDALSLSWQEATSLRDAIRAHCPHLFEDDYRDHPERHHTCPRE